MATIYSQDADGRERIDTVAQNHVAEKIKVLRNMGQLVVRVI